MSTTKKACTMFWKSIQNTAAIKIFKFDLHCKIKTDCMIVITIKFVPKSISKAAEHKEHGEKIITSEMYIDMAKTLTQPSSGLIISF